MSDLEFDRQFDPAYGEAVPAGENVARLTVNNPSPFTFHGTNSYIVGRDTLAVIDPGPEDEAHFQALLAAIGGRPVSHIFVSHTHADHSPLTARLKEATGAIVAAEGPHRAARALHIGEINPLDASSDTEFRPDIRLRDGEIVDIGEWAIEAIATPGHTANHMAFALKDSGLLFSADHVMAWATSIVAPPDGAMADFMASLDRLAARDERRYLPGHGGPVDRPQKFVRALRTHRKMREAAILDRIRKGDRTIPDMVREIYRDTDPRLFGAAGLSVLAHLEDLVARGLVVTDGPPAIDGIYSPA
ncbi:MBL fold metallo-hydrolase [Oricola nitratireducens]|jgi:glyoxylase-like metal-dependent hydrolase (beta-lactamase superfamily II)|uniref:MBL fold metallo-hydrolase n=1 Tax=Oricola nitratireducens TaxID=2775868 RepID=UPI0018665742|nr:MBL fold metallo-hydrolase [Oricola nitratireducens]